MSRRNQRSLALVDRLGLLLAREGVNGSEGARFDSFESSCTKGVSRGPSCWLGLPSDEVEEKRRRADRSGAAQFPQALLLVFVENLG